MFTIYFHICLCRTLSTNVSTCSVYTTIVAPDTSVTSGVMLGHVLDQVSGDTCLLLRWR